ncbi:uncharacterized protein IL334_006053 [Kwoniella shivajii]|uniref:Uncharacterized protein n=1 Tax=Kwoniella shivajii TaxID=564305 RepID=A0ABZ1D4U7_9TREE|nr:hypothetical protein IL334_006053 [Kwoniella shivajii]
MSYQSFAAPIPQPLLTSIATSNKGSRLSDSSISSHASSSSTAFSWTPSRDSVYSTSSDGWSATVVTPRKEKGFELEIWKNNAEVEGRGEIEYIDLAGKESWWNSTQPSSRVLDHEEKKEDVQRWLDDSPTLPSSSVLPEIDIMPSSLSGDLVSKKRCQYQMAGKRIYDQEKTIFDVFETNDNEGENDTLFSGVSIHRPFTTKIRPPLPNHFTDPIVPVIPSRNSSRRRPVLPSRGSSLKSLKSQESSGPPVAGPSRAIASHRPTPARTFSHPPPTTNRRSSLHKHRRLSPALLQPISETPKDLDVPPDASWALRSSPPKIGLAKSTPNLRRKNLDMTLKFKFKRSSSQKDCPGANDFMPCDSFPSSRDLFEIEREGRASLSDIARSFISSLPDSPGRISLDGRPDINLGLRKSPKTNSLLGLKKSQSQRRPSLLGLPEWNPRPNARSMSDSHITQSSSRTLDALRRSRDSPLSNSEDIFGSSSKRCSISSNTRPYLEEDLLAVLEAENWDWPSPPFRINRSESTPGLSTSGTLESMASPQTPSESEFVLHGEVEWLAKAGKEKKSEWRSMSLGESIESIDISL